MGARHLLLVSAVSILAASSAAEATTVAFSYNSGVTSVASGSFSFADGSTGVLGYGDLTSFSVDTGTGIYTLADVVGLTDYVHFGYDTAAVAFTIDPSSCGFAGCGFQPSLSAINSTGTFGFFFTGAPGGFSEYSAGGGSNFDTITFNVTAGVPEAASWAMLIAGFGLTGAAMRRRRPVAVAA